MNEAQGVKVRLFAVARQLAGVDFLEVALPPQANVSELRAAMAQACPALAPVLPHALFSVNAEYASEGTLIPPAAELACIPPVSGG